MWFLIKSCFWFSLVLAALPLLDSDAEKNLAGAPKVEASSAITAVAGTIKHLTKLCADQPEVCEAGSETAIALSYRAREGAQVAYKMIDHNMRDEQQAPDPVVTATIVPVPTPRPTLF